MERDQDFDRADPADLRRPQGIDEEGGERAPRAFKVAKEAYQRFLLKLHDFEVLDPACGSGNFLYLALLSLKEFHFGTSMPLRVGASIPLLTSEERWSMNRRQIAAPP